MLKLARVALTAAILVAIGVRLRRRTRIPEPVPPPALAPVESAGPKTGMWLAWAVIAAVVAVTMVVALIPPQETAEEAAWGWTARYEQQQPTPPEVPEVPEGSATPPPTAAPELLSATELSLARTSAEPAPKPGRLGAQATCTPVRRPVRIRPIDPAVERRVARQWRRIERWLKANAPVSYRELPGPGRARTIAIAESQMGMDFPDGLRASLLRHNGSGVLQAGDLSIRGIRDTWRELCRKPESWWLPGFIPVKWDEYGGMDVANPGGTTVLRLGGITTGVTVTAGSFTELLRQTADAMEADEVGIEDGRVVWPLEY
ncbi:SMI1/KNR4 family protein [Nonomuraea typhae]|uniref:SMI1/KNR4 family protein n=1 Tax=Nonomuraea typhae TaxID=2603600 RepID=UPI0012F7B8B4|nr:SMI1/KNR4 family protein [Nonomuraea typhae]